MITADKIKRGACPLPEDVVATVMDGMDADCAYDMHITQCEGCRRLAQATAATRDRLRLDADEPVLDRTAHIMAGLPADAWAMPERLPAHVRLVNWRAPLRIAATLAALLGAAYVVHRHNVPTRPRAPADPTIEALQAGRQWLLEHQQASGGWDAVTLDGRAEYTEALNGLAIMAIINAGENRSTEALTCLHRAADYLRDRQTPAGLISRNANAAMYNHGIATLALLEIDRLTGDWRLGEPIDKALATICSRQSPAGGWGYRDDPSSPPNTAITAWQVKALLQARAQGRDVPVAVLRKALNWMVGTVGPQGYFGYEGPQPKTEAAAAALTLMGAHCLFAARDTDLMNDPRLEASVKTAVRQLAHQAAGDYHQAYFMASVITQLGDPNAVADAHSIRQTLLARQIRSGTEAGAWQTADDRWGTTGGKLYSTAMAMLTLAPPAHESGM
jgi:hypothetical protein